MPAKQKLKRLYRSTIPEPIKEQATIPENPLVQSAIINQQSLVSELSSVSGSPQPLVVVKEGELDEKIEKLFRSGKNVGHVDVGKKQIKKFFFSIREISCKILTQPPAHWQTSTASHHAFI